MRPARSLSAGQVGTVLARAALALLALSACRDSAPAERPELHLITALPLLFAEQFTLAAEPPAITVWLNGRYRLTAPDLPSRLPAGATVLMAQPRAFPAEELVALDQWVRSGGRLLLLADPRLEWPSERPLGDPLRAPPMYADTGLLGHWGLQLDAPDRPGPVTAGGVTYVSPGSLTAGGGPCRVAGQVARCAIGRGRAIVVADADWLSAELVGGRFAANAERLGALIDSLAN